jgi:hypothetical protein
MENKYKFILIATAGLLAVLIYYLGLRKYTLSRFKKKNFFTTSLLIALALIGFDSTGPVENNANNVQPDKMIHTNDSTRIKALNNTPEWKEFKSFWKDLDNIQPGEKASHDAFMQSYVFREFEDYQKNHELGNSLRQKNEQLKIQLTRLVKPGLLDSMEPTFLFELCNQRIQYIYYGNTSMMSRMMPSPGTLEREKSIAMLEFKIDTLLNLEKKGSIDSLELKQALDNIITEVKTAGILGIIANHRMLAYFPDRFYINPDTTNNSITVIDRTVLDFQNSYDGFMKNYDDSNADDSQKQRYETYVAIKKELDAYAKLYPGFCELIADLILND